MALGDVEAEAVAVLGLAFFSFRSCHDRSDGGGAAGAQMCGASRGDRRSERLGVGILVVVIAMALRKAQVGVNRPQLRAQWKSKLPLFAVLAMVGRCDVSSREIIRIARDAQIVVGHAPGQTDGKSSVRRECHSAQKRVLPVVVVPSETVVLPMLGGQIERRSAGGLTHRHYAIEQSTAAGGEIGF